MDKRIKFYEVTTGNFKELTFNLFYTCWANIKKSSGNVYYKNGDADIQQKISAQVKQCKLLNQYLLNFNYDRNKVQIDIDGFKFKIIAVDETSKPGHIKLSLESLD